MKYPQTARQLLREAEASEEEYLLEYCAKILQERERQRGESILDATLQRPKE